MNIAILKGLENTDKFHSVHSYVRLCQIQRGQITYRIIIISFSSEVYILLIATYRKVILVLLMSSVHILSHNTTPIY